MLSDAFRSVGTQKLRPAQYARTLEALTGFRWTGSGPNGAIDYLDDDNDGYRVLGGGIDSFYVTKPVHTMIPTAKLVTDRAAWLAAQHAVANRTLVKRLVTDEASVRATLVELHARIYGELDADVADTYALFAGVLEASNAERAWTVTLAAMLGDVRSVYF